MNDTTVRCQNASVTEPKREKGDREAVDEVSRKKQLLIRQPMAATFSRRRRLFILPLRRYAVYVVPVVALLGRLALAVIVPSGVLKVRIVVAN